MKIGSTTRTWIYVLINIALTTKHNIVSIAGVWRGVAGWGQGCGGVGGAWWGGYFLF